MGISKELLAQVGKLLRPLENRIANMVARGVVQRTNDGKKLQLIQLGVLKGQTVDAAEFMQAYGFSSVPLEGAEAVVLFPNGDGSHPIVLAVADRRYRPTGAQPGEVTIYNHTGARITITKDGDIVGHAAPGRTVSFDDGSGAAGSLLPLDQFMNHSHASFGAPPSAIAPLPAPQLTGTSVLQGK